MPIPSRFCWDGYLVTQARYRTSICRLNACQPSPTPSPLAGDDRVVALCSSLPSGVIISRVRAAAGPRDTSGSNSGAKLYCCGVAIAIRVSIPSGSLNLQSAFPPERSRSGYHSSPCLIELSNAARFLPFNRGCGQSGPIAPSAVRSRIDT